MPSGTPMRAWTRLLDASASPLWVIAADGSLAYLSAATISWLGIDGEALIGRRAVAGAGQSQSRADAPRHDGASRRDGSGHGGDRRGGDANRAMQSSTELDRLAASLAPPPGIGERGTGALLVQPPGHNGKPVEPLSVRFVRVGDRTDYFIIAVGGSFQDTTTDDVLSDAAVVRQRLDRWRKESAALATVVTAGTSTAARRTRTRLRVAASTRTNVLFMGPRGCGAQQIAVRVHQLSAPAEPIVVIDGSLMDAELLDASMMPVVNELAESDRARGTALVSSIDETPSEAQQRLFEILSNFGERLRLLALAGSKPGVLPADSLSPDEPPAIGSELLEEPERSGIHPSLLDLLSTLSVRMAPLASRVADIPLIAAALLDARHAAGDGVAERWSRQALDLLVTYPWPGEFDELEAAVGHAIKRSVQPAIAPEHLPLAIRSYRATDPSGITARSPIPLEKALHRYEMQLIHEAIKAADGNKAEAARRLDISRAKLLRRLDEESKQRKS